MSPEAFHRYLRKRTTEAHPAYILGHDPAVEYYDGTVRIFDQRGESCSLRGAMPRQLRALATMLHLCAEEIERRNFEG